MDFTLWNASPCKLGGDDESLRSPARSGFWHDVSQWILYTSIEFELPATASLTVTLHLKAASWLKLCSGGRCVQLPRFSKKLYVKNYAESENFIVERCNHILVVSAAKIYKKFLFFEFSYLSYKLRFIRKKKPRHLKYVLVYIMRQLDVIAQH